MVSSFKALLLPLFLTASLSVGLGSTPNVPEVVGMTAAGKLVRSGGGNQLPWMNDIVVRPSPEYPVQDRRLNHQGRGLFRIVFDVKTGSATDIIVRKSTGWRTLDDAVITAFRQFRVKPGKWKYFELPVIYVMSRSREEAMETIRRLQNQQKQKPE
jgi:TonB family protein